MGVLDGHGPLGHHASAFLKQHLPVALVDELGQAAAPVPPAATDPGPARATLAAEALTTCFLDADAALGKSVDCQYSGSTAVVSLLEGRRLTTAWVGDSRAVLVRQEQWGLRGLALTRDHKPTGTEERARILAAGGRVDRLSDSRGQPVGPARVWLGESWVPGLAMSRALGDIVAHSAGVSSHPDVSVMEVTPQDRFLILASDGVWEFMDCQAAADLVAGCTSAEEACRTVRAGCWSWCGFGGSWGDACFCWFRTTSADAAAAAAAAAAVCGPLSRVPPSCPAAAGEHRMEPVDARG